MTIRGWDTEKDDEVPEKNVPLFRKAVEWVEYQEELEDWEREWNQRLWMTAKYDMHGNHCGTAYCVAGYVCVVDGWVLHDSELASKEGRTRNIMDVACELLGIDQDAESTALFGGANNAAQVRYFAEELCGERL